jgi:hypothetical protein
MFGPKRLFEPAWVLRLIDTQSESVLPKTLYILLFLQMQSITISGNEVRWHQQAL